ncbi:MAG: rRNA maturation RNase YbeY [Planctomycetota bacterium]
MSTSNRPGEAQAPRTDVQQDTDEPPSPDEPGQRISGTPGARQGAPIFVSLLDATARLRATDLSWLDEHATAALALTGASGEVSVRVVTDAEMASAHETHTGVGGTTDVLTFDLSEERTLHADLLVCIDEAERQAKSRRHALTHELLLYILHGSLHCLGFDDRTDDDSRRMHAEEDRLLKAIGIGEVFARRVDQLGGDA